MNEVISTTLLLRVENTLSVPSKKNEITEILRRAVSFRIYTAPAGAPNQQFNLGLGGWTGRRRKRINKVSFSFLHFCIFIHGHT